MKLITNSDVHVNLRKGPPNTELQTPRAHSWICFATWRSRVWLFSPCRCPVCREDRLQMRLRHTYISKPACEKEYAEVLTHGIGPSVKMGRQAPLQRVRRWGEDRLEIILTILKTVVRRDLGVPPGESLSWTRHAYDEVIDHFRSLKKSSAC